jgi:hypothetical protein
MPAPNIGTLPFDGPGLVDGTWLKGILAGQNPLPSSLQTYFGGGLGSFLEEGNLSRQISAAGVTLASTGADVVLAVYSIPASSFDAAGRGLTLQALGSFAANANNKTVNMIFNPATAVVGSTVGGGGTTVATTGVSAGNGVGWQLGANIFKYGALGSNTQFTVETATIVGTTHGGIGVPANATAVESAAILIAVTGNAATTATDIIFNFLEVNAMN